MSAPDLIGRDGCYVFRKPPGRYPARWRAEFVRAHLGSQTAARDGRAALHRRIAANRRIGSGPTKLTV